jgi:hypothetical protein
LPLLCAQITQLLLFLAAQLPKLRATKITPHACLPLLCAQVSDLLLLLRTQLTHL